MKIIPTIVMLALFFAGTTAAGEEKLYTLEDAYQAALSANETVKIAEEDVAQSDFRVEQAWTYLYPRLVGKSSYTKFNDTLPAGGGAFLFQPDEQFQAALILTQPLYTGGRTLAAIRMARKLYETRRGGLAVTKQDTLLRVAEAYYAVLKAQKLIEINRRSFERMEHHQQVTAREARTRKSKANASALLRANTLVSQAKINLIRAQDGITVAKKKLSLLTQLPVDMLIAEPHPPDQPAETLSSLMETALNNRDDYASAKLNQNIASENVTIVRGAHFPQLYAEAGLTYQDSRPMMVTDATGYYGGLRLQIPIFEGGLMKAEVSEAKSKVRQAELSSDFLRKSIETEVHEVYMNLQTITSVLETARLQMDYAKGNFEAVDGLFFEGLVSSLSVIDAEQALNMAENELMNTTYDRQVAILRLKKSIGMLGK